MKNKGIIGVIAGIMVIGMVTTFGTSSYISKQEEMESSETAAAQGVSAAEEEETSVETFALAATPQTKISEAPPAAASPAGLSLESGTPADSQEPEVETTALPAEASLEETVSQEADSEAAAEAAAEEAKAELSPHHKRLMELDAQIQKIRDEETESTTYSMKTAAENELKLWDSELNAIYNDILDLLDEEEKKEMVQQERDWMKERDALAVEAAKRSSGGTLEGLEYTASLAQSTRQRAYELADLYTQLLEEKS